MRGIRARVSIVLSILVMTLAAWGSLGQAQSPLEEWAKQQISEKTGIDPKLLATLFFTEGSDQLMLAFVYITPEVLESNLKPDLKQAIARFVGQNAMLSLVIPTRRSQFNPLDISFSQDGPVYLLGQNEVHAITEDFHAGQLEANAVSAGVLQLPSGIDLNRPFQITYRTQSAPFSLSGSTSSGSNPSTPFQGFLLFFLQFIFLLFLFPFLLGI